VSRFSALKLAFATNGALDPSVTQLLTSPELAGSFIDRTPWNRRWFSWLLAGLLVGVDYLSGPSALVPTYFILPVMLLAWNWGARMAVTLALILSAAHLGLLASWGISETSGAAALNAFMRVVVLLVLATVTARLGRQTRAARERVKMLEGMLPICAYCKDIRDENNQWQQIEAYVSQHSAAEFSHGICPKCAESHFGKSRRARPAESPRN
jgi:hypothetical protein